MAASARFLSVADLRARDVVDLRRLFTRVNVVGTSGSGKSTLAAELASRLDAKFIELDALHWGPNWSSVTPEVLRERLAAALSVERWVVDGNYNGMTLPLKWERATLVVWLDLSYFKTFWQVLRRTVRRAWRKEVIFSGNRESWRLSFMSRDSIILWMMRTHFENRRQYTALAHAPEHAHVTFVRVRSLREARELLKIASALTGEEALRRIP